jgi:hypothetical protein
METFPALLSIELASQIKTAVAQLRQDARSSHLTEVVARGLGFKTNAALVARLKTTSEPNDGAASFDFDACSQRLAKFGYPPLSPDEVNAIKHQVVAGNLLRGPVRVVDEFWRAVGSGGTSEEPVLAAQHGAGSAPYRMLSTPLVDAGSVPVTSIDLSALPPMSEATRSAIDIMLTSSPTTPPLDAIKALDGRVLSTLSEGEMFILSFYRRQGRKFDVSIAITGRESVNEPPIEEASDSVLDWSEASTIRVSVGSRAETAWAARSLR